MERRELAAVVAIAEEGSFTAAADRLRLAQPALSTQIARLERRLGYDLFERVPRGAILTEAGRRLLPSARAALQALAEVELTAQRSAEVAPMVRVGVSFGVGMQAVVDIVGLAHAQGLAIGVERGASSALRDRLRAGELDLAVVSTADRRAEPGLRLHWLEPVVVVALVGGGTPAEELSLAEVLVRPLVILGPQSGMSRSLAIAAEGAGAELVVAAEVDSPELVAELSARGVGTGLVPAGSTPVPVGVAQCSISGSPLVHRAAIAWSAATAPRASVQRLRDATIEIQ